VSLAGCGDVIVRRRDNVIAYQLAVVVDDAFQGVTDVVRGCDLLASTPWQIALQSALALPGVSYAHLPVITEPGGEKLAKSRRSVALDAARVSSQLCHALELLQQTPPPALAAEPPARVWDWARRHWRPHVLQGISCVQLSPHGDSF
jgi:glutamyl-Q tRNA(Asp) synthetase